MQADPVSVRVGDDTHAHVGRGVVEVTHQVHGLRTALWAQQNVQLLGPGDLIWGPVRNRTTAMK